MVINIPPEHDNKLIIENYLEGITHLLEDVTTESILKYTQENTLGGWEDHGDNWATGRRELKVLYFLIRFLKPKSILEIGTHRGHGLSHILQAAKLNEDEGFPCQVTTLDIVKNNLDENTNIKEFNRIIGPAQAYLKTTWDHDFIVQDGDHTPGGVLSELSLMKANGSVKWLWAHDYFLHGKRIGKAIEGLPNNYFEASQPFIEEAYQAGFFVAKF